MNKNDLISSVAESSGLTKADAGRAVDGVFDSIASALASGDDVRIVGFGSFSVANRAASSVTTSYKTLVSSAKSLTEAAGKGNVRSTIVIKTRLALRLTIIHKMVAGRLVTS